jgi:hypothetical protein
MIKSHLAIKEVHRVPAKPIVLKVLLQRKYSEVL